MIALFLLLVIIAIALGLVGVVVKGLLFLLPEMLPDSRQQPTP